MKGNLRFTPKLVPPPSPVRKSDEIALLIALAKDDTYKENQEVDLGVVPNSQGQFINEKTAIKTNGFKKIVSNYAIKHAFKGHGNDKLESERGQKGVGDSDIQQIPFILVEPDIIEYGGENSRKENSILFIKKIGGFTYYVVMAVKEKKRTLSFSTMYIKR